jgi:hypothetical protein
MGARAEIQGSDCGFRTQVTASAEDSRHVHFVVSTDCEKVAALATGLTEHGPFDAFDEIDPRTEGSLMSVVRQHLQGCCSGCAVPVGLFKAMQVAAGVALPQDISIAVSLD